MSISRLKITRLLLCPLVASFPLVAAVYFSQVDAIFTKHCLDCHAATDPEAKLVLESYETLLKGGESGPAIAAGKSGESLLVKMIGGREEKDGKRKIMPAGKRKKLETAEIETVKSWEDAGAKPPSKPKDLTVALQVPKNAPKGSPGRA